MPTAIHQMQITFVPLQDRLLFRFNTTDQCEFSFWFTRRYVKRLWPALLRLLESTQAALPQAQPAKSAVLSFQHEQAITQADFATPYRDPPAMQRPLGPEPILVSQIQIKPGPGNHQTLCLHPEQGQGVELAMDARLTHFLCRLLAEGIKQTDWDLRYELAGSLPVAGPQRLN